MHIITSLHLERRYPVYKQFLLDDLRRVFVMRPRVCLAAQDRSLLDSLLIAQRLWTRLHHYNIRPKLHPYFSLGSRGQWRGLPPDQIPFSPRRPLGTLIKSVPSSLRLYPGDHKHHPVHRLRCSQHTFEHCQQHRS